MSRWVGVLSGVVILCCQTQKCCENLFISINITHFVSKILQIYVCLKGIVEMAYYSQRDGDRWKRLSSYVTRMPFQHFIKTHKASEI